MVKVNVLGAPVLIVVGLNALVSVGDGPCVAKWTVVWIALLESGARSGTAFAGVARDQPIHPRTASMLEVSVALKPESAFATRLCCGDNPAALAIRSPPTIAAKLNNKMRKVARTMRLGLVSPKLRRPRLTKARRGRGTFCDIAPKYDLIR
jgi:hypothetical protein